MKEKRFIYLSAKRVCSILLAVLMFAILTVIVPVNAAEKTEKINIIDINSFENLPLQKITGLPDDMESFDNCGETNNLSVFQGCKFGEDGRRKEFIAWSSDGLNFNYLMDEQLEEMIKGIDNRITWVSGYVNVYAEFVAIEISGADPYRYAITENFQTFKLISRSDLELLKGKKYTLPEDERVDTESYYKFVCYDLVTEFEKGFLAEKYIEEKVNGEWTVKREYIFSTDGTHWIPVYLPSEMKACLDSWADRNWDTGEIEVSSRNQDSSGIYLRAFPAGKGVIFYKIALSEGYYGCLWWSDLNIPDFYYTEDFKTYKKIDTTGIEIPVVSFTDKYSMQWSTQNTYLGEVKTLLVLNEYRWEEDGNNKFSRRTYYYFDLDNMVLKKSSSNDYKSWSKSFFSDRNYFILTAKDDGDNLLTVCEGGYATEYDTGDLNLGYGSLLMFSVSDYLDENGNVEVNYLGGMDAEGKYIVMSNNFYKTCYRIALPEKTESTVWCGVETVGLNSTNLILEKCEEEKSEYYLLSLEETFDYIKANMPIIPGDISGDGKINAVDARWVLQAASGAREFDATQAAAADVNGDGKINAVDARWILQIASGARVL